MKQFEKSKKLDKQYRSVKVNMKFFGYDDTPITRVKLISGIFTMLSIIMFVYLMVKSTLMDGKYGFDFLDYAYVIIMLLCLISNLLLYQATIQLSDKSLYYWPKPKYCILFWITVHLVVLGILFSNTISNLNLMSNQEYKSAERLEDPEMRSKTTTFLNIICFIIGQVVILIGMKMVTEVVYGSNNNNTWNSLIHKVCNIRIEINEDSKKPQGN